MRCTVQYECQGCYLTHKEEQAARECHPPKKVYICGDCGMDYDDSKLAELCCLEGANPKRF